MVRHFLNIAAFFAFFLSAFIVILPAHAAERLDFSEVSASERSTFGEAFADNLLARVDLNDDGLDEYVFKTPAGAGLFHFRIYALPQAVPIMLSELKAHNVMPGNDYEHGVRNLLVFKDALNDFSYDIYAWSPKDAQFKLSGIKGQAE